MKFCTISLLSFMAAAGAQVVTVDDPNDYNPFPQQTECYPIYTTSPECTEVCTPVEPPAVGKLCEEVCPIVCREEEIDWTPIGFVIQPNVNAGQGNKNFCLTAKNEEANSKLVLRECDHSNIDKKAIWSKGQTSNTIYASFTTWTKSKTCILSPKNGGPLRLSVCENKKKAAIDWDKNGSIHTIKSNLFTASEVEKNTVVTASPPSTQRDDIQNWKWIPVHQKGMDENKRKLYATLDSAKLWGHTPFSYEKTTHPGWKRPGNVRYDYFDDDADYQSAGYCTPDQQTRLDFAVRYMRAASISQGFEYCLRNAVTSGVNLGTSHEMLTPRVGPYVRCHPIQGNYQPGDPELQHLNMGYDVVMNVVRANRGIQNNIPARQIYHKCTGEYVGQFGTLAESPAHSTPPDNFYRWDWTRDIGWGAGNSKTHRIEWTDKFYSYRPLHAAGESTDPLFGDLGTDSYPVDELSGVILHEMLHNVKFAHGPSQDPVACNYDVWNCPHGPSPTQTCRMNSLNEIAEACMSEIVQFSTDNCDPLACDYGDEVNLFEINQAHTCDYDDDFVEPGCGKLGYRGGECRCTRFW
eukprot:CAMPEP_0171004540 /NCGR_PEP_ID=MMETSP0736-20130129/17742_1 /TAXON_ID=186038 /ORGANISM="Fragilariopsis kerguelensis, Strain L26-C5" /LENGTH=577 /DNA_ID=CAMNT_0011433893 /DNA_START=118 /DNA_END=1851 /DNA_ORIENTATION=+